MFVHSDDAHADPLAQHLGMLANRLAENYQDGNYVAAAFDLGEMQSYVFENFTHDWCDGVVDWITDALDICERAARLTPSHFCVIVDELPHHLGRTEPTCDCLSCSVLADYAVTVELAGGLEDSRRTSQSCGEHLEMVANVMLENMGSSMRIRNQIDVAAQI